MKLRLFNFAAACSLLMSLAAGGGWALSYARPMDWRAVRTQHAAGWQVWRPEGTPRPAGLLPIAQADRAPGTWRAWWARSSGGRLTLLRQRVELGERQGSIMWDSPTDVLCASYLTAESGRKPRRSVVVGVPDLLGPRAARSRPQRLGFAYDVDVKADATPPAVVGAPSPAPLRASVRSLTLPYWFQVLVGLPLPALWLRANRRTRNWTRRGLCLGCGYDMRASPGRCPECGRAVLAGRNEGQSD